MPCWSLQLLLRVLNYAQWGGKVQRSTRAVAGPRTGPVCRAMFPVPIQSVDRSVTESEDDSQVTLVPETRSVDPGAPMERVDHSGGGGVAA